MTADRQSALGVRQRQHKKLARRLVEAVGGVEAAASFCRVGKSQLSDFGNENLLSFMPADVIDDLEALVADPLYTRWQARERGFAMVPLPDPHAPATRWSRFVAALGKEGGDLIAGICTDLDDDNDVTPAEARRRLGDAGELVRVAVELEAALKARAGEEG